MLILRLIVKKIIDYSLYKGLVYKNPMKRKAMLQIAVSIALLATVVSIVASLNQTIKITALAQTTTTSTFDMDGEISSLVLGVPENTKIIDMTTVQKFILSGDWSMSVDQGKLTNFTANFYTGPVNGANNHTHQLSNFRVNNSHIQLNPDNSLSISGLLDVGTGGNKAWNNVNATVVISKGRTISISLDDTDTQRHFMEQQIYGTVKEIKYV
jgi:hypothetical protein